MDAARPQVETLAIRDDTIIAAGTNGEIEPYMFENVRDEMDPSVAAISTILVLISVFLLLAIGRLNRRRERLHSAVRD